MRLGDWLRTLRGGAWTAVRGAGAKRQRRRVAGRVELLEQRLVLAEDWGDAPDTISGPAGSGEYPTRSFSNGARHTIVAGLRLGTNIDAETTGPSNTAATGDDSNVSGGPDDEDGVVNPLVDLVLTVGTQPTVTLRATNTTGTDATLTGFIDFGNDGEFSEFTDRAQVTVPTGTNNGTFTLTFPAVPTGSEGKTWARFRLSTDPQGGFQSQLASDGEVEDYPVTIIGFGNGTTKSSAFTRITHQVNGGPTLVSSEGFGAAADRIGDVDGDGIDDLVVGSPYSNAGASQAGRVFVLFMNADRTVRSSVPIGHNLNGGPALASGDRFGFSVAGVGDFNADGIPDIAVGARGDATGGADTGAVYLLMLNSSGVATSRFKLDSGNVSGVRQAAQFGSSVTSLGDFDGDGVTDLAVGASANGPNFSSSPGTVHIVRMNANGTVKSSTTIGNGLNGGPALNDTDRFGSAVANLGDFDGDGITDLAVGAFGVDAPVLSLVNSGAVYVLRLNADGTVRTSSKISTGIGGANIGDTSLFGRSLSNLGDIDGDGLVDLAVGASGDDQSGADEGAAHVVFLNAAGTARTSVRIAPVSASNQGFFGTSVVSLGDVDGDGVVDLGVGSFDDTSTAIAGGAFNIIPLAVGTAPRDYGDAPDATDGTGPGNYQTRNADGGPSHSVVSGMLLGSKISVEPDATANARANGDDIGVDDEDGVVNPQVDLVLTTLAQPTVTLRATNNVATSGKITGWIDANNNGVFETSERAEVVVPAFTVNGTFTLTFPVIPQGFTGTTYARFRLTDNTVGATSPTGPISGGEVEDYVVTITAPSTGMVKTGGSTKLASGGANMPSLANIDYFGSSVANIGDLDGDGVADLAVGAPGDDTGGAYRGVVHVLYMNANGTVKTLGASISSGSNGGPALADGDYFGSSVTNIGDLDGDGVTDLAVGAPGDDTNGGVRGAVHLLFLNSNGSVKSSTKIASGTGGGPTLLDGGRFGTSVANMGDLDGNGVADLAVGAVSDSTGGSGRGAVYVLFLNSSGTVTASTKLASGGTNMPVLADTDRFGSSVANVGDLDGDGITDLAIGARGDDTGGPFEGGAVYILLLNASGGVKASGAKKIANATGGGPVLAADSYFGSSLANVGDLDGDGLADLAVGAMRDDTQGANRGAVYLLFLNANGTTKPSVKLASAVANVPALANGDHFGSAVANLGDLDGDGVTDLAIGAYLDDTGGTDRGAVHILRLNAANLAPTGLNLSANSIAENSAVNTPIGTFTTTDAASTFTYTLVTGTGSDDNGSFTISGNQLQSAAMFNFEATTTRSIRVRTTDAGGLFFEQSFTINITNVNETPTGLALSNTTILETIANGAAVGDFSTTDPDAANTFTYTLVTGTGSTNNASFTIVGNQLRVNTNVDNDNVSFYSVRIRTTDQGGLFTENSFTITVTNVNEAPTALNLNGQTIAENLPSGTAIGTFSSTDPDSGSTFTYALVAGAGADDNGSFTIVGDQLRSNAVFNFEAKSSFSIRVRTTDQTNLFLEQTFTITVTNVNEAPVLDNSGNIFAVLGVGSRQSDEMRLGVLISDLLARGAGGKPISDPDTGALRGIAITGLDQSLGQFQFNRTQPPVENGWLNMDGQGPLSDSRALLLPLNARIRFVTGLIPHHAAAAPFLPLESKLDAGITFRAWDRTTGEETTLVDTTTNGGSTAFSSATETVKVYFEARLFRTFNSNAGLNIYSLEAEFNALTGNPAIVDRSTSAFTGFTVLLSAVPELGTAPVFRMYFGVQFNGDGTETDMGYRYLTTNSAEADFLEGLGRADLRPRRQGAYFREIGNPNDLSDTGVNNRTAILGYIYTTQQPGTLEMTQVYRTDSIGKPTRPGGTPEGSPPNSTRDQEQGDHVYTTNTAFETSRPGTWRIESSRGFVRELTPNPTGAGSAIAASRPATLETGTSGITRRRTGGQVAAVANEGVPSSASDVSRLVAVVSLPRADAPSAATDEAIDEPRLRTTARDAAEDDPAGCDAFFMDAELVGAGAWGL